MINGVKIKYYIITKKVKCTYVKVFCNKINEVIGDRQAVSKPQILGNCQ